MKVQRPRRPPALKLNEENGIWQVEYWCQRLKRYTCVTTGTSDKTEASLILDKGDIAQVALLGQVNRMKRSMMLTLTGDKIVNFGQAVGQYLRTLTERGRAESTVQKYKLLLSLWRIPDERPLELINESDCEEYLNRPDETHFRTRKLRRVVMGSFLKFCQHHGWVSKNVAKLSDIKRPLLTQSQLLPMKRQPFTEAEMALLLANTKDFWNLAIRISAATGLRLGDVATLQWISLEPDGRIYIGTNKTGSIVYSEPLPELVAEIRKGLPNASRYCFPKQAHMHLWLPSRAELSAEFKRILRRLKIDDAKSFHCIRHGFAQIEQRANKRKLLDQLLEEFAIDKTALAMGHSSSETTKGYLNQD